MADSWLGEAGCRECGHWGIAAGGAIRQDASGNPLGPLNPMTGCTAADTPPGGEKINPHGWAMSMVAFRHQGKADVIWVDGHAKAMGREALLRPKDFNDPCNVKGDPDANFWDMK
jgi:prepilin-type processing-associated H-X9-DG protein